MSINKFLSRFGITSERTIGITKHIGLSFFYKLGAILANFLLVPLSLEYLGKTNYGIWLIIISFIGWFTFFDVGLGHGLRNKFSEAKAKKNMHLVKAYVSSAYFTLVLISITLIILFFLVNFFIDWTYIFNTNVNLKNKLSYLMLIVFSFFAIQLVFKLITTIYTADQKPSIGVLVNFLTQIISLTAVWLLLKSGTNSLFLFGLIYSTIPVLILLCLNFFSFKTIFKPYKPSLKLWQKKYVKDIFGLGLNFFIVQIAAVILYTTDNLIITHLFSPNEVVPYNIAFKYFSIVTMVFSIIVTPYWSAITDAFTQEDFNWIKKSMKMLIRTSFWLSLLTLLMLIFSKPFYYFWVGSKVTIPFKLSLFMAVFVIQTSFIQSFTFFINGTGKIKIQMILGVSMALLNIPLSILLVKYFKFDTSGVILATILCNFVGMIIYPIQYIKIIDKKAKGIWNE